MKQKGLPVRQAGLAPIVIVVLIATLAVGGYLIYKLPRNVVVPQAPQTTSAPSPTPSPSPAPTGIDETTNWKTYTNTGYRFSLRYPQDYNFDEQYVEVGILKWSASISSPKYNTSPYIRDIQQIGVTVRKRNQLSLEQWINEECPKLKDLNDLRISNKPAKRFICPISDSSEDDYMMVAIDNGDYIYTLNNIGFKKNTEQEKIFDQILSTFRFLP